MYDNEEDDQLLYDGGWMMVIALIFGILYKLEFGFWASLSTALIIYSMGWLLYKILK